MGVDAIVIARTPVRLTDDQIRRYSWLLGSSLGSNLLFRPTCGGNNITRVDVVDIEPIPDEDRSLCVKINLMSRFYGPGYERGHWPTVAAAIMWVRAQGWDAFYGGDSGVGIVPVTDEVLAGLWAYWCANGSRPYMPASPDAPLCPLCQERMTKRMWGPGDMAGAECWGCGAHMMRRSADAPWLPCDRDFKDPQAPKVNRDLAEGGRDVN